MRTSENNVAGIPVGIRLSYRRVATVAVILAIVSEVSIAPLFYLDYSVGFGGAAMLAQFALGLLVTMMGSAAIMAMYRKWYASLPALLLFALLYGLASEATRFALIEPTAESGSFTTNLKMMLGVGVADGPILLALVIIPAAFVAKYIRRTHGMRSLLEPQSCWRCCYSLEGLPTPVRCPECGTAGQPRSFSRPLAMFLLGEGSQFRRARWGIVAIVALVAAVVLTRLALAEARQTPGRQLPQATPQIFAEPPGRSGGRSGLGKALDVSAQFGVRDPYRLFLVMSLEGESPPRSQLLLMYAPPWSGGTGMGGIAFGELTSAQRDQVSAGATPPAMLTPITRHIASHQGAIGPVAELWTPPPTPPNE